MAAYQYLTIEKEGACDVVTLNRPDRFNALGRQMVTELIAYFTGLREDYKTRVVILRGAGKAFCSGLDLQENFAEGNAGSKKESGAGSRIANVLQVQRRIVHAFRCMRMAPQPIIALVHGACCGGGLGMALAADIRLVTPEAKMNVAMYKIGLTGGDMGISYLLPRLVGTSVAAEMMMTGRFMYGPRAVQTNLASELFPNQAEMEKGARQLVKEMLAGSPDGLRLTKDCIQASVDAPSFESQVSLEDRQQVLMVLGGDWFKHVGDFNKKSKL
mmetsp:Transcript_67396/g.146710  ORF Transcript_67396/g.146710 Transcript_67396/m.146710 type:complete len:272 (+) Transcript_67396:81-896(+)